MLWIDNLSVRDPYFILPALNAVFMFATQRLTPMVGMDPLQQKMMQAMPIVSEAVPGAQVRPIPGLAIAEPDDQRPAIVLAPLFVRWWG